MNCVSAKKGTHTKAASNKTSQANPSGHTMGANSNTRQSNTLMLRQSVLVNGSMDSSSSAICL